jgi:cell wall integrity and stress response component
MKASIASILSLALVGFVNADPVAEAKAMPTVALSAYTKKGCFSAADGFTNAGSYTFQTSGWCQKVCVGKGKAVMGLQAGSNCWCGDEVPATADSVDTSKCNSPCNGYNTEMCRYPYLLL